MISFRYRLSDSRFHLRRETVSDSISAAPVIVSDGSKPRSQPQFLQVMISFLLLVLASSSIRDLLLGLGLLLVRFSNCSVIMRVDVVVDFVDENYC